MADFDRIPVDPTHRIPALRDEGNRREPPPRKRPPGRKDDDREGGGKTPPSPDDGKPHVDEYA